MTIAVLERLLCDLGLLASRLVLFGLLLLFLFLTTRINNFRRRPFRKFDDVDVGGLGGAAVPNLGLSDRCTFHLFCLRADHQRVKFIRKVAHRIVLDQLLVKLVYICGAD